MDLMWFVLGVTAMGAIGGLAIWNSKKDFSKLQLSGLLLSVLTLIFAIAWFISSIAEKEVQAAAMGIMIFGGIAVLLFILSLKLGNIKDNLAKNKAQ